MINMKGLEHIRHMDSSEALKYLTNVRMYYRYPAPHVIELIEQLEEAVRGLRDVHGD